jgi:hypothetical protein
VILPTAKSGRKSPNVPLNRSLSYDRGTCLLSIIGECCMHDRQFLPAERVVNWREYIWSTCIDENDHAWRNAI